MAIGLPSKGGCGEREAQLKPSFVNVVIRNTHQTGVRVLIQIIQHSVIFVNGLHRIEAHSPNRCSVHRLIFLYCNNLLMAKMWKRTNSVGRVAGCKM